MNNLNRSDQSGMNNFGTGDPAVSNTGKNTGKFKTNSKLASETNQISKNSLESLQKTLSNVANKIANKVNNGFENLKSKIQNQKQVMATSKEIKAQLNDIKKRIEARKEELTAPIQDACNDAKRQVSSKEKEDIKNESSKKVIEDIKKESKKEQNNLQSRCDVEKSEVLTIDPELKQLQESSQELKLRLQNLNSKVPTHKNKEEEETAVKADEMADEIIPHNRYNREIEARAQVLENKKEAVGTEKFFTSLELQFIKAKDSPAEQKKILEHAFNWIKDPKNHDELVKHEEKFDSLMATIRMINKSYHARILRPFVEASVNAYNIIKPLNLDN